MLTQANTTFPVRAKMIILAAVTSAGDHLNGKRSTTTASTTSAVPCVKSQLDFYEFIKGLHRHTELYAMSFGYNDIQLVW